MSVSGSYTHEKPSALKSPNGPFLGYWRYLQWTRGAPRAGVGQFGGEHPGSYDSDKQAALTLGELQRWLVLAVATPGPRPR